MLLQTKFGKVFKDASNLKFLFILPVLKTQINCLMKQTNILILFLTLNVFAFTGCRKSAIQKSSRNLSVNSAGEVSLLKESGISTLTLRPGPGTGQDAYVAEERNTESINVNYVPELSIASWTIDGQLYRAASYIRFDSLVEVPASSTVVSAKLYLYGLSSSSSTPQGNSGDNACYIKRVLEPWDESVINYANRPQKTADEKVILPASTSQWSYNPVIDVTSLVSYIVAHPSENFGFFVKLQTQEPYRSLVFGSSEQSDKNLRPKLVVKFK